MDGVRHAASSEVIQLFIDLQKLGPGKHNHNICSLPASTPLEFAAASTVCCQGLIRELEHFVLNMLLPWEGS